MAATGAIRNALTSSFSALKPGQKTALLVGGGAAGLLATGVAVNQITGAKHSPVGSAIGMGALVGGAAMVPRGIKALSKSLSRGKGLGKEIKAGLKSSRDFNKAVQSLNPADADYSTKGTKLLEDFKASRETTKSSSKEAKEYFDALEALPSKVKDKQGYTSGLRSLNRKARGGDDNFKRFGEEIGGYGTGVGGALKLGGLAAAGTAAIGGTMRVMDRGNG